MKTTQDRVDFDDHTGAVLSSDPAVARPDVPDLERELTEKLEGDPDNLEWLLALGEFLVSQGRYPEAQKVVERAVNTRPDSSAGFLLLARVCQHQGNLRTAALCANQVLSLDAGNAEALSMLAEMDPGRQFPQETASEALLERANQALENGDPLTAKGYLQQVVAQEPERVEYILLLGNLLLHLKEYEAARRQFYTATMVAPDNGQAFFSFAMTSWLCEDFTNAEQAVQAALKIDPNDLNSLQLLAEIRKDAGKVNESIQIYEKILRIAPGDPDHMLQLASLYDDYHMFDKSVEIYHQVLEIDPQNRQAADNLGRYELAGLYRRHSGVQYRTPSELQVSQVKPGRVLIIGSCLSEVLQSYLQKLYPDWQSDFYLTNNLADLPPIDREEASRYQFQVIQVPLRTVMCDDAYFRLPYDDPDAYLRFFETCRNVAVHYLRKMLQYNQQHQLLTFVIGLMTPQVNPMGFLLPRHDLRNLIYFVEELNKAVEDELRTHYQNCYYIDLDQIASTFGKKYFHDDRVWMSTHGGVLNNFDHDLDQNRLHPPRPMTDHYLLEPDELFEPLMYEIFNAYRIINQLDTVKLVAVDLDDTLWRGIAVEGSLGTIEGWPHGFVETLLTLKKRGVLLAIVSKNSEDYITQNWEKITNNKIRLDDFVIRRINFTNKAQNLAEIIQLVNIRPNSVVMVDDNPVERKIIQQELPEVRVLGSHPYYLKQILLWSAETQRPFISAESAQKTQMVHAQIERETLRQTVSTEEFLQSLQIKVSVTEIRDIHDPQINRALELFNKTNQYNTTGERYSVAQFGAFFDEGQVLYTFNVKDRFTQYGNVGALWVKQNLIRHFVMSCRVLGLGVENAILAYLCRSLKERGEETIRGILVETEANLACRPLYKQNGFSVSGQDPAVWQKTLAEDCALPPYVELTSGA